jgi:hemoglobin/transferrin/lactoferrin receptor protein
MPRVHRPALQGLLLVLAGLAGLAPPARSQDPPPADTDDTPDVIVTATRHPEVSLDTPWSVRVLQVDRLRGTGDGRSLPNQLSREPGVLMQKTGPGQSSPFLRGFTGFRTLWMVDGIRLNNSVWRDGPNQYAGTVDGMAVDRLEVVKGPGAVLWGSDAVGGTINARTLPADPALGRSGFYEVRGASGERSLQQRIGFQDAREDGWGLKGGVSVKDFGRIQSGGGSLSNTEYDEHAFDARLDLPPDDEGAAWSFGTQSVRQDDVPRTHKTVFSESFHGTTVGSELQRELDQARDLLWSRVDLAGQGGGLVDGAALTFSLQRQQEDQTRVRTGGRWDERGFDVTTAGVQLQLESETDNGLVTWGFDAWRDEVDSYRTDVTVGATPPADSIQGPVADDSSYDLLGVYVQNEIVHGDWETTLGARGTYARADAGEYDNPNVAGSNPLTPGNVLSTRESWTDVSASLRTLLHVDDETSLWAGLSQSFRAPNLSDLTSDLEDTGAESPSPDLDPEHFVTLEVGAKVETDEWNGEVAVHRTWMRDTIVRSPTGAFVGTTPVFRKDNAGDGWVHGIEVRGERRLTPEWTVFGSVAWLDGEVDQFTPAGVEVTEPLSRLMPLTALSGVTYEPERQNWWVQADVLAADEADELSLRDMADTERIPPGGTPGWAVVGVRGGVALSERATLGLALENLLDKDHRIHGSGQNEPGRSLVVHGRLRF